MSLGFKRSRSAGSDKWRSDSDERMDPESLFEKEWDELVIRYDQESQKYRVGVRSESHEKFNERSPAKTDH
jgi:hypothetical protein